MLQNKNLYDPIVYIINQLNKKKGGGAIVIQTERLEEAVPVDLIRTKGLLTQIRSAIYTIDLVYAKGKLTRVTGQYLDGSYKIVTTLIYNKGLLVRVEPVETTSQAVTSEDTHL